MKRCRIIFIALAMLSSNIGHIMAADGPSRSSGPAIEPDPKPSIPPAGYRWYIVRDPERVYSGRADGVSLGADVGPMFGPDELVFEHSVTGELQQRPPKYAGEVSRILLPSSYRLPSGVASLHAVMPSTIPPTRRVDTSSIRFEEVAPAAGTPAGYKAYRFIHPSLVFSGIAAEVSGAGSSFQVAGHDLHIRKSHYLNEASTILLPSNIELPKALRRAP